MLEILTLDEKPRSTFVAVVVAAAVKTLRHPNLVSSSDVHGVSFSGSPSYHLPLPVAVVLEHLHSFEMIPLA